jgi:hypothetical protein
MHFDSPAPARCRRQQTALGAPRWLTPPKGPARVTAADGGAAAAGNDDHPRQPPASQPSLPGGSPACGNPAAAAARAAPGTWSSKAAAGPAHTRRQRLSFSPFPRLIALGFPESGC